MLEGRLARLRPLEPADVERAYRWMNDREVTRFLTMRCPMSMADEERWLREQSPSNFGRGVWLAIETKDGAHIGNIGLHPANPEGRNASLGIIIGEKTCWSNGYGTDAIVTLLRFAFGEMNLHRVWLTVLDAHKAGIACYRKCGFREEARLRQDVYRHGRYYDFVVMGVLREEFEALHGRATPTEEGGDDA